MIQAKIPMTPELPKLPENSQGQVSKPAPKIYRWRKLKVAYSEKILTMYPYLAELDSDGEDDIEEGEEDEFVRWDPVNRIHVRRETPLTSTGQNGINVAYVLESDSSTQSLPEDQNGLKILLEATKMLSERGGNDQDNPDASGASGSSLKCLNIAGSEAIVPSNLSTYEHPVLIWSLIPRSEQDQRSLPLCTMQCISADDGLFIEHECLPGLRSGPNLQVKKGQDDLGRIQINTLATELRLQSKVCHEPISLPQPFCSDLDPRIFKVVEAECYVSKGTKFRSIVDDTMSATLAVPNLASHKHLESASELTWPQASNPQRNLRLECPSIHPIHSPEHEGTFIVYGHPRAPECKWDLELQDNGISETVDLGGGQVECTAAGFTPETMRICRTPQSYLFSKESKRRVAKPELQPSKIAIVELKHCKEAELQLGFVAVNKMITLSNPVGTHTTPNRTTGYLNSQNIKETTKDECSRLKKANSGSHNQSESRALSMIVPSDANMTGLSTVIRKLPESPILSSMQKIFEESDQATRNDQPEELALTSARSASSPYSHPPAWLYNPTGGLSNDFSINGKSDHQSTIKRIDKVIDNTYLGGILAQGRAPLDFETEACHKVIEDLPELAVLNPIPEDTGEISEISDASRECRFKAFRERYQRKYGGGLVDGQPSPFASHEHTTSTKNPSRKYSGNSIEGNYSYHKHYKDSSEDEYSSRKHRKISTDAKGSSRKCRESYSAIKLSHKRNSTSKESRSHDSHHSRHYHHESRGRSRSPSKTRKHSHQQHKKDEHKHDRSHHRIEDHSSDRGRHSSRDREQRHGSKRIKDSEKVPISHKRSRSSSSNTSVPRSISVHGRRESSSLKTQETFSRDKKGDYRHSSTENFPDHGHSRRKRHRKHDDGYGPNKNSAGYKGRSQFLPNSLAFPENVPNHQEKPLIDVRQRLQDGYGHPGAFKFPKSGSTSSQRQMESGLRLQNHRKADKIDHDGLRRGYQARSGANSKHSNLEGNAGNANSREDKEGSKVLKRRR